LTVDWAHSLPNWLSLSGHGAAVQGVLILLGTFVLEDAATILAAMDVQVGRVSLSVALISLYLGIVLGDLGLYGLGRVAAATPWAKRWAPPDRFSHSRQWLCSHVFTVVFISRFLPGARLPTYTACGYFGASVRRFATAAILATLIWTTMLFGVSLRIGKLMVEHMGEWRWAGMAGFALAVILAGRLVARLQPAHAPAHTP
jgi:membrane protein DedA with SNARE-associated domain